MLNPSTLYLRSSAVHVVGPLGERRRRIGFAVLAIRRQALIRVGAREICEAGSNGAHRSHLHSAG